MIRAPEIFDISANMQTFLEQLRDAQQLAGTATRRISRTLRRSGEPNIGGAGLGRFILPDQRRPAAADSAGDFRAGPAAAAEPPGRRPSSRSGIAVAGARPPVSSDASLPFPVPAAGRFPGAVPGVSAYPVDPPSAPFLVGQIAPLLREQTEIQRKVLDVLTRQLKALDDIRQGIPAVLT